MRWYEAKDWDTGHQKLWKEEAILIALYHLYHNLLAFLLIKLSWYYEKIADMTSDIVVSVFDIIISDSARYV